jgi:hypothetical protein
MTSADTQGTVSNIIRPMKKCRIRSCDEPISDDLLMCATHWRYLPSPLRRAIWRHYRPNITTPEYTRLVNRAVDFITNGGK